MLNILYYFHIPIYFTIYKLFKNIEYSRLYTHILLSFISAYEIIKNPNVSIYYLKDYNLTSNKLAFITLQHFTIDTLFLYKNPEFLFHHFLALSGVSYQLYYNNYFNLSLYVYLGEFSTICLDLIHLNIKKRLFYKLFEINFIIFRLCLLPVLTYNVFFYNNKLLFSLLFGDCCLHLYWVSKMKY